ncbi:MAG: hypothetical protein GX166_00415 [Clostridiaceae bacterium]|nr:hypothetical protein [Clostridiaceae bacterium]
MIYGNTSFIFTGDAEDKVEHDILASNLDLKADVLKVGHHGSTSSTTALFLNKIKPAYAVISVGEGNRYGHPDDIIMQRLALHKATTLRTDELGTIIFTSDGTNLTYTTSNTPGPTHTKTPAPATETPSNATPEPSSPVVISALDKIAEYVSITNNSDSDIDMTGWKILSVTGNQQYNFSSGYLLKAGSTINIASGGADGDLIWTKANIWNNTSSDPAELYDNTGKLVSRYDD